MEPAQPLLSSPDPCYDPAGMLLCLPSALRMWPLPAPPSPVLQLGHDQAAHLAFLFLLSFQILALCHIAVGQQLNLHWIHKVSRSGFSFQAVPKVRASALWLRSGLGQGEGIELIFLVLFGDRSSVVMPSHSRWHSGGKGQLALGTASLSTQRSPQRCVLPGCSLA